MTQTLSWMFLRDTWNKQTMIVNSRRSFCGEDVFCRIHLVTGEPLSKGTTYDLCRHKKMQQQTAYKKVTFMNKLSRFRGLTCKQAIVPHGILQTVWLSMEQPARVSSEIKFGH